MLTPSFFRAYQPVGRPAVLAPAALVFDAARVLTGTNVIVEGTVPTGRPVLFATNSTQKHDFLPFRRVLRSAGQDAVSIVKPKYMQDAASRAFLGRCGVVPLASRGFLLSLDFVAVLGRRPTATEYRRLREHVDHGTPLAPGTAPALLASEPHTLLDRSFDPSREAYDTFLRRTFEEALQATLGTLQRAVDAGRHVHVYPEGTVNPRLGRGRTGAVQLAHALGLDIVPVGLNGAPDVLGERGLLPRGGELTIRFGPPIALETLAIPTTHRAFVDADERTNGDALHDATERVMAGLDALLEPKYQRSAPGAEVHPTGSERFL